MSLLWLSGTDILYVGDAFERVSVMTERVSVVKDDVTGNEQAKDRNAC